MVLRVLLRYLLHNEQLIQRLADSYPFRRAAQITAHVMLRGKSLDGIVRRSVAATRSHVASHIECDGQESLELMSTSNLLRTLIERVGRTTQQAKDISSEKVKKLEQAIKEMKRKQGL